MQTWNYRYLTPWHPTKEQKPPVLVVTCFLQKDDKILVLQRAKNDIQHNLWGIPGGKLDKEEDPVQGLSREIEEETGTKLAPQLFTFLNATRSNTPCDGEYGLYLYHAVVPPNFSVQINPLEHHSFLWVSLEEFESLELLTAQREAYLLIKEQLQNIIKSNQRGLC